jgi:hypothetical protein
MKALLRLSFFVFFSSMIGIQLANAQEYFTAAIANVEHLHPVSITVSYAIPLDQWNDDYNKIVKDKSLYTITDITDTKKYNPSNVELVMVQKKDTYKINATLYLDVEFVPEHLYFVQWTHNSITISSKDTLAFKDCIQEKLASITFKPILANNTVAIDFNLANNIIGFNDMLITWNAKGYIDFSNKDSISNTEINAECTYPISTVRPHPFFIGKLGGDFDGHFTSADLKASAGMSILDQYLLPPILKFIGDEIFHASMPVPPPVLAVFGEAGLPWSREKGIQDSVMWRLAGEIDINVPMGNGNFMNVYARGWLIANDNSKSFIEFAYKKEVTRNLNVVLQWLNGALPPLFENGSSVRAGVSFAFPTI